jgi:DNA/RNA endonuclease YhcR with UshA esterase domain
MTRPLLGALLVGGLLGMAMPSSAHHAANAKYDEKKPVTITGMVTKVEWMNPHVYFYVDVKNANGTVTNWAVENGTPNQLYRRGWRKDSLKVGDTVTVQGFAAKEQGLPHVNGRAVTLPDGRKVFSGSADGLPTP